MDLRLLRNSSFIFAIAIAVGFLYPGPAGKMEFLITPALVLMMTFSTAEIEIAERGDIRGALIGLALNYIMLSGLILALSTGLDENMRLGFAVMAAVPPAIAVVPLTKLLDGDLHLSLYGEALSYLASLVLMPSMILIFAGRSGVSFWYTFEVAIITILLPLILSRFARKISLDPIMPINLGFFLVTYTVVGLNRGAILENFGGLALIAFARTFGTGAAVYAGASLAGVDGPRRISYTLFGSYKNLGLAAAVSIALFGPQAAVPSAVCILAENLFYIFMASMRKFGKLK